MFLEGFFPKIDLEYSIKGVVQAKKCFDPLHHQPLVMVSSVLVGIFFITLTLFEQVSLDAAMGFI